MIWLYKIIVEAIVEYSVDTMLGRWFKKTFSKLKKKK